MAQAQQHQQQQQHDAGDKKRKETILDLSKYLDKPIRVKFAGGREASGVLKGYDPLLNLVLDGTTEYLRDPDDQFKLAEDTRSRSGRMSWNFSCPHLPDGRNGIHFKSLHSAGKLEMLSTQDMTDM